ncbi:MAG: hypothetical protein LBN42_03580 [Oscillospiraceae bacterium]|jgi:hypothetical protein|nr:hypothetical protein [Oscillospiraceae bacterium]
MILDNYVMAELNGKFPTGTFDLISQGGDRVLYRNNKGQVLSEVSDKVYFTPTPNTTGLIIPIPHGTPLPSQIAMSIRAFIIAHPK